MEVDVHTPPQEKEQVKNLKPPDDEDVKIVETVEAKKKQLKEQPKVQAPGIIDANPNPDKIDKPYEYEAKYVINGNFTTEEKASQC